VQCIPAPLTCPCPSHSALDSPLSTPCLPCPDPGLETQKKGGEQPGPPHLWPLLLSLSLVTLPRHHVPNVTLAPLDMPPSRQSHALPLPQPTRTVSCPPETILRAPSPVYKKPPFFPEKIDTTTLSLPDNLLSALDHPVELAGASRSPRPPPVPSKPGDPPTRRRSRVAEKHPRSRPAPSPPLPVAAGEFPDHRLLPVARSLCFVGLGKKPPRIPIRF
jgi:hypothetical protein